jgi:site-specific DNA-cytosine methylase
MKAIGLLAGVGSLLREAQDAGLRVVGNVEARTPYHTGRRLSWDLNFPQAELRKPFGFPELLENEPSSDLDAWWGADLALGHPPCNSHSVLGNNAVRVGMSTDERAQRMARRAARTGLLPLFVEQVRLMQPKTFALDNLPKILKTVAPPEWWEHELPDYRMTYLVIKNWDYGTPQLRERLWVVGVRKPIKRFAFAEPRSRLKGPLIVWDAIKDLPWQPWVDVAKIGHVHKKPDDFPAGGYRDTTRYQLQTQAELALGFLALPPKQLWEYRTESGRIGYKFGRVRLDALDRSSVLSGLETLHHPLTGWPLTPRERARLMQWPDDFQLGNAGTIFDRSTLMRLVLFTGKAVPSGFPRYLIPQLVKHLRRRG